MMLGIEALKIIERHQGEAVVITTMTPMMLWDSISSRQELHLPLINSMGKASSIGLGLALACPERKILVIDGDGSLLMNLGSLVSIANLSPPNLVHFVYKNGIYGVSGGQPVPGSDRLSFVHLAESAGYPNAFELDQLEDLALRLPQILQMPGPTLVCLNVDDEGVKPMFQARLTTHAFPEVQEALARARRGAG
jgi:phosphonopyruvate decarboxylase